MRIILNSRILLNSEASSTGGSGENSEPDSESKSDKAKRTIESLPNWGQNGALGKELDPNLPRVPQNPGEVS